MVYAQSMNVFCSNGEMDCITRLVTVTARCRWTKNITLIKEMSIKAPLNDKNLSRARIELATSRYQLFAPGAIIL